MRFDLFLDGLQLSVPAPAPQATHTRYEVSEDFTDLVVYVWEGHTKVTGDFTLTPREDGTYEFRYPLRKLSNLTDLSDSSAVILEVTVRFAKTVHFANTMNTERNVAVGIIPDSVLSRVSVERHARGWSNILCNPDIDVFVALGEADSVVGFARLQSSRDADARADAAPTGDVPCSQGPSSAALARLPFGCWRTILVPGAFTKRSGLPRRGDEDRETRGGRRVARSALQNGDCEARPR